MKALVIDDNTTNLQIVTEMLTNWGMRPKSVTSGQEALDVLDDALRQRDPYPVAIVDRLMPGMDGFEFTRRLIDKHGSTIRVVMMMSSTDLGKDAARCRALGIAEYVTKPVKQSDLLDAITRIAGDHAVRPVEPTAPVPPQVEMRAMKILLAEDNQINQRLASRLLEKRGHTVVIAENGRAAVEASHREPFDVILMDVQMPEMDGFEATQAIRAEEQNTGKHVRIIAMTAHAMKGDRERCLEMGMDAYIAKPLQVSELLAALADVPA